MFINQKQNAELFKRVQFIPTDVRSRGVTESPEGFPESSVKPDVNVDLEASAISVLFIA
jgi:hypothetical protein